MRSEPEIRAAIATLERSLASCALAPATFAVMSGELSGLRYVLREETALPTLEMTLDAARAHFAKVAAMSGNES